MADDLTDDQKAAQKAADKRRKEVESAMLAALLLLRDRMSVTIWWLPGTWSDFEDAVRSALGPISDAQDEAAKSVWLGYDSLDPQTVDAERAYRDKVVTQVSEASRRAITQANAWAQVNGLSEDQTNILLKAVAGTNAQQAASIMAVMESLIEEGAGAAAIIAALGKLAAEALKDRSKILSGDALWDAVQMGQLAAGKQEQRATNAQVTKTWNTAEDELVCPVCGNLNGVTVPINQPFPGGFMAPKAHSRCRCRTTITVTESEG